MSVAPPAPHLRETGSAGAVGVHAASSLPRDQEGMHMEPKVARIHQLIADGFTLAEIDSDHGVVEAHLLRGATRVTVRLLPSEAERLLYEVDSARLRVRRLLRP